MRLFRNKNEKYIVLGVAILIALALIFFVLGTQKAVETVSEEETGAVSNNYSVDATLFSEYTGPRPDLERVVRFGSTVSEAQRVSLQEKIDAVRKALSTDGSKADEWLTLGVLYHGANDFDGAREVWEFLLEVMEGPRTAVLYDNLGKMYKFQVKDFPKSEKYFLESIRVNPNSTTPYFELFELYRYLYKTDGSAAVNIITQAADAFPTNSDPYVLLGSYYRDMQKYDLAREAFQKALDRARELKNVQLIDAIGNEISSLPK